MTSSYDYHLLNSTLLIAVGLFVIGAVGLMARRNLVVLCFSAAIMFQGVCLAFCSFGSFHGDWTGRTSGWIAFAVSSLLGLLATASSLSLLARCRTLDVASLRGLAGSTVFRSATNDSLPVEPIETQASMTDTADHA